MSTKNIAFIIPSLGPGGAERVVVSLANKLCNKYNISLILLYKENNILYNIDERITIFNCSDKLLESNSFLEALKNNRNNIKTISNYIKQKRINCLIGFTTTSNIFSIICAKKNKIPCIISDRSNPNFNKLNLFWKTIRYLVYPKCNYLVVQSKLSKTFFSFVKTKKIKILPNPLAEDLAQKKDITTEKENIILYVARLDANKSQDTLLKAFTELEYNNYWKLALVGDGNKREFYENLTEKLNIKDKVLFTGRINNPEYYYNRAKIFAFTSKSEGFPNALIEAQYFGLPCVSTNCPSGPSELISDGENGYLIPVGDHETLTEKLNYLINNESVRKKMSLKSIAKAEDFHIDKVSSKWDQLISSLL